MRRVVAVSMLFCAAVWMGAQTKKPAKHTTRAAKAKKSAPAPVAAGPSKITGPAHKTPSGAEYWDIKPGTGEEATKGKTVSILYVGWLADGKKFGATDDPDIPLELTIGNGRQIKGWDEGMVGMRVGGKRQLRIPPSAAYGSKGAPPVIPPNATLIMDVQLVGVKPGPKPSGKTEPKASVKK